MNLIVQGKDIPTPSLKQLAKLTGARSIEAVSPTAFRLVAADPGRRDEVAAFCEVMRSITAGCRPGAASATSACW